LREISVNITNLFWLLFMTPQIKKNKNLFFILVVVPLYRSNWIESEYLSLLGFGQDLFPEMAKKYNFSRKSNMAKNQNLCKSSKSMENFISVYS